jgi:hypothetical protein
MKYALDINYALGLRVPDRLMPDQFINLVLSREASTHEEPLYAIFSAFASMQYRHMPSG